MALAIGLGHHRDNLIRPALFLALNLDVGDFRMKASGIGDRDRLFDTSDGTKVGLRCQAFVIWEISTTESENALQRLIL
jgi:hypothetical protein